MTRLTLVLAALLLAFAAPTTAFAQDGETNAPPGNSAIDEYVETVPGASGDRKPRRPSGDSEAPAESLLPDRQRQALEQRGPEGQMLADLVDATAPPAPAARKPGSTASGAAAAPVVTPTAAETRAALQVSDARAESPLKATLAAAVGPNDAGGLGIFFPLILLASLLGMVVLAMRRRRLPA